LNLYPRKEVELLGLFAVAVAVVVVAAAAVVVAEFVADVVGVDDRVSPCDVLCPYPVYCSTFYVR